jgi:Family of unknown function (DUF5686)/CarboxypepD_reg-like domain
MARFAIILFIPLYLVSAQTLQSIFGTVVDASNNRPLPAATVRITGGSNKGTITNDRGQFRIPLASGKYTIIVSYLGYRSDTIETLVPNEHELHAALSPEAIKLPEVVITDEDPAIAIIRQAIESKPKWMGALKTFQCEAYSRNTITLDTTIGAIVESYGTVYWRANDSLREVVHQKRQTKNLPVGDIVNTVGQVTNFNDDTIRTGGFKFVGPTSADAFSYYDYKLLKTRLMDGMEVYDIKVIPKSRVRPLFSGVISIAERSYAVISVDFEPNEAYTFPFLKEIKFHYQQQFRLYEERFWMPVDYRVQGQARLSLAAITIMKFSFNRYVVMSDYLINPVFADTLAKLPRLTVAPEAATFDSSYWVQHALLPLNQDEEIAYKQLDSTQTLDKQFEKKAGALNVFGNGIEGLSYVDVRFNRVEGLFLGGKMLLDSATNSLILRSNLGYGFADRIWKYSAGATFYVIANRSFGVGVDYYRKLDNRPDENYYHDIQIFFGSLFSKDDYRDYFLSRGWQSFLQGNFLYKGRTPNLTVELGFKNEQQSTLLQNTDFSLLGRGKHYRENPAIVEGTLHALTFTAEYGNALQYLFSNPYLTAHGTVEYSSRSLLKSDFDFTRISGALRAKFPTYNLDLIFNPTLSISLSGGIVTGTPTPQRMFDLESSYYGTAWFGTLRGARVKEFSGDRFVSLTVEHNFRRVPFLLTGIPFLYENNLEIIAFSSIAQSWLSSSHQNLISSGVTTGGWYYEMGFSVSRILDLFRLDLTWRGKEPRGFVVTLGIADFF